MSKGADKFFLKTNQFAATEAMDTSRQTALDDGYRQWVDKNLQEIVRGEFAYPGCIEFWRSDEPFFDAEVRELINRSLGQAWERQIEAQRGTPGHGPMIKKPESVNLIRQRHPLSLQAFWKELKIPRDFRSKTVRVLTALVLFIFSSTIQAIDIKPSHSGNWFNPYQAGHGFDVQVIEGGETVIFWYAYDADGAPIWIFAQGPNEGNTVTATAYWHDGMRWNDFNREDLNQQIWGTITIEFHSCNSATVRYDSEHSWGGDPFGSGTVQVKRLTSIANNKCTENMMGGNYLLAGVNSSHDSLIGSAVVFENGVTMFGTSVTNGSLAGATVGVGQITEQNNGRFMMEVFEVAVDGSWSEEFILWGENIPGRFTIEEDNAVLYGVELRYDFMTQIPVSAVARSWAISDITGQSAGSIRLHTTGAVSGDVLAGCSVAGEWFFPNSQFNQIRMNLEFNNCSTSGETHAAATYDPRELSLEILGLNEHVGFILTGQ